MATKIDTVTARDKLKPRREQYWHRISKGSYLGFRKMTTTSPGTWWARYRSEETGKQVAQALGSLEEHAAHARFDKALALAREWLERIGLGGATGICTVKDACADYVEHTLHERGEKPAKELQGRFVRWLLPDPISRIDLSKLTREHVKSFRRRMIAAPVTDQQTGEVRERSKDTINRDMTAIRAALNYALADGRVTTDFAWREALKPFKNAGKRRELYLDRDQRRALLQHAPEDLAAFLRAMTLLPLRPGALAELSVAQFDKRLGMLKVGKDKAGADRKVKLPEATTQFLQEQAKGKLPGAPMLACADGQPWNKRRWGGPVKEAAIAAGLPIETTAYALRHSVITDLVTGGLDLLTVAQISGTSVAMIEKHYGSLRGDIAATALAKLAL